VDPPRGPGTVDPAQPALKAAAVRADHLVMRAQPAPDGHPGAVSAFPDGNLPPPETALHRRATHLVAIAALLASASYLTWRAAFTLGADLWISIPLVLLEIHAAIGLALFTFSLWDLDALEPPPPAEDTGLRVAVLVPTYNEPREILLPTVAAATALSPRHETWVLDDGNRDWVRRLAEELGARYLARAERTHAKAGNINHALRHLDADVVAILDADHVAAEGLLERTLGYFADPAVAVVQTPQDFYNVDSFEHGRNRSWFWPARRPSAFSEQRLFYRALQPGKNRWDAAFWCGTNALVRVTALREVGGVAHETVTEDIHTTVRLHRAGWSTAYHNEVLAYGLAARSADEYRAQRVRWGTGAMQLLRLERPLTGRGLTLPQRLAYATTLLGWFDAWRTLGFLLVPVLVLFTGAVPIQASPEAFFAAFGATFLLHRVALSVLSRGNAPQGMALLFELVRMQSSLGATLTWLRRRGRSFEVTAKQAADRRRRVPAPSLLRILLLATLAAVVWFGLTLEGLTPVTYRVPWTAYGALAWGSLNAALTVAAIARVSSQRFASDRRAGARVRTDQEARLDGFPARLLDVSAGGALVHSDHPLAAEGGRHMLSLPNAGGDITLAAHERSRRAAGADGTLVGLQFLPGQDAELARLAVAVFGTRAAGRLPAPGRRRAAA
jgi:cellulose synthase/poly-beta-1,6-N-acetylglucosamine synthase-like glycosyltransferase